MREHDVSLESDPYSPAATTSTMHATTAHTALQRMQIGRSCSASIHSIPSPQSLAGIRKSARRLLFQVRTISYMRALRETIRLNRTYCDHRLHLEHSLCTSIMTLCHEQQHSSMLLHGQQRDCVIGVLHDTFARLATAVWLLFARVGLTRFVTSAVKPMKNLINHQLLAQSLVQRASERLRKYIS